MRWMCDLAEKGIKLYHLNFYRCDPFQGQGSSKTFLNILNKTSEQHSASRYIFI